MELENRVNIILLVVETLILVMAVACIVVIIKVPNIFEDMLAASFSI